MERGLLTNGKGMHNQVLSGSTPSIFLLQVLPLRCDMQGWPQNKNFISQFRRKKNKKKEKRKKKNRGKFFKSVFIKHQNKATVLPKPSHLEARGGQAAKKSTPGLFPLEGKSWLPAPQCCWTEEGQQFGHPS